VRRIPSFCVTPISGAIEPEGPVRNAIVDSAANLHNIPSGSVFVEKVALREASFELPLAAFPDIIAIIG
jgi:hypothetical protein